jgi:hypothetical protein
MRNISVGWGGERRWGAGEWWWRGNNDDGGKGPAVGKNGLNYFA